MNKKDFIYRQHDYNKQDYNKRRAVRVYMMYINLQKSLWSGLAQDCWQELPSGVTTISTKMAAGEEQLEHQLLSSKLHLEDDKWGKYKRLNNAHSLNSNAYLNKEKRLRWRQAKWRHFPYPSHCHHDIHLLTRAPRIQAVFCFRRASIPLVLPFNFTLKF